MFSKSIAALAVSGACALAACSSSATTGRPVGQGAASTPAARAGTSSFCPEMASAGKKLVALGGGDPAKVDPATYQRETSRLVAAAPPAVKSDIRAISGVELEVVQGNLGAEAKLQQPAMLQHVRHFVSWMQGNCPGVLDDPTALPPG